MREKSPDLQNPTESVIAFNEQDFVSINEQFSNACINHGDGDSFEWTAGGGEYSYAIQRIQVRCGQALGAVCCGWELVQKDNSGNVEIAQVNITHRSLHDVLCRALAHKVVNDVYCAAIDLAAENRDLDSRYKYLFHEDADGVQRRVTNPYYASAAE